MHSKVLYDAYQLTLEQIVSVSIRCPQLLMLPVYYHGSFVDGQLPLSYQAGQSQENIILPISKLLRLPLTPLKQGRYGLDHQVR